MITIEKLKEIIFEEPLKVNKGLIKRDIELPHESRNIIVISGIRRCGKSTLLFESLKKIAKIAINFEDTRLTNFEKEDFLKLEKIAHSENITTFVFDEIQNIPEWEKYMRSLYDKGFHIYITGSNASLLSRELGTKLTGRYLQTELYPFSYSEYLRFKNENSGYESFEKYLNTGGFPEYLESTNEEYLRTLLRDIVIRDIAVRRNIKNEQNLLRLTMQLISNIGKEISYNNLTKLTGFKSVRTTIDYCDFLKESYLFDLIPRFSFSIKQQIVNPQKIYAVDNGMVRANSLSFSEDRGRLLENAVFLHLRRQGKNIFYYKDQQSECDFMIKQKNKITLVIQVCLQLTEENLKRELSGLQNAMVATSCPNGMIVTLKQEDNFGSIKAIPAWQWFLGDL